MRASRDRFLFSAFVTRAECWFCWTMFEFADRCHRCCFSLKKKVWGYWGVIHRRLHLSHFTKRECRTASDLMKWLMKVIVYSTFGSRSRSGLAIDRFLTNSSGRDHSLYFFRCWESILKWNEMNLFRFIENTIGVKLYMSESGIACKSRETCFQQGPRYHHDHNKFPR